MHFYALKGKLILHIEVCLQDPGCTMWGKKMYEAFCGSRGKSDTNALQLYK